MFGDKFVSVANTGDDETMKDVETILKTYLSHLRVKDGKPKTQIKN
jgi:hypothetical protein